MSIFATENANGARFVLFLMFLAMCYVFGTCSDKLGLGWLGVFAEWGNHNNATLLKDDDCIILGVFHSVGHRATRLNRRSNAYNRAMDFVCCCPWVDGVCRSLCVRLLPHRSWAQHIWPR